MRVARSGLRLAFRKFTAQSCPDLGALAIGIQCPACQHLIRIPNPPAGTGFTQIQPAVGQTWATQVPKGKKA